MKTEPKAFIIFQRVMDTMKAQSILKKAGYLTDLIVPPDDLCECCELGLVVNPTDQHTLEKLLKENGLCSYRFSHLA